MLKTPGDTSTDGLPPTQQLVLEVLAARARLGEHTWTFTNRVRPALAALEQAGLLWQERAPVPGHRLAGLTGRGRDAVLSAGYAVPGEIAVEWGSRHGSGDGERVRGFGEGEKAREASRRVADDFARAGRLSKPVCRRVIRERWTEYPDEFHGSPRSEGPS